MTRRVVIVVSILVILFSIYGSFTHPVSNAEAQLALTVADADYNGERILQSNIGEEEPRRLPLPNWWLAPFGPQSGRIVALLTLAIAALAIGFALGGSGPVRSLCAFGCGLIAFQLIAPASPALPLAALLTLAMATLEIGRRHRPLATGWWLAPLLGAAASLVWSPALLLVMIAWSVEWISEYKRGERPLRWSWLGLPFAIVVIALWQIPFARLSSAPLGWFERILLDLTAAPISFDTARLLPLVTLPALLMLPRSPGRLLSILCSVAALIIGEPLLAATALIFLGATLGDGSGERPRRATLVTVLLILALQISAALFGQQEVTPTADVDLPHDAILVIDRRVETRDAWSLSASLQRPPRRSVPPGVAWALSEGELSQVDALGWSLMATPLTASPLPQATRLDFEAKLQAARAAAAENPNRADPLPEIWVGRRLAYLGRFNEAVEHYSDLLERFPNESRILRHRGHRYISLRRLDRAIADLERAAELERGRADRVEPDGLPNAQNLPRSTTQNNIYYHLGLAHYLRGDSELALASFQRCRELSTNDDMLIATAHWLQMLHRRLGLDAAHEELCAELDRPLEILENDGYQRLLELYCGARRWDDAELDLENDAIAYGVARWLRDQGEPQAETVYDQILRRGAAYSFGAIAAEADLARELRRRRRVAW